MIATPSRTVAKRCVRRFTDPALLAGPMQDKAIRNNSSSCDDLESWLGCFHHHIIERMKKLVSQWKRRLSCALDGNFACGTIPSCLRR
jgi:hypothetical protein